MSETLKPQPDRSEKSEEAPAELIEKARDLAKQQTWAILDETVRHYRTGEVEKGGEEIDKLIADNPQFTHQIIKATGEAREEVLKIIRESARPYGALP